VVNLATHLALAGERVLVIDLIPGAATSGFGIRPSGAVRLWSDDRFGFAGR
jgi:cellulose biosynthesis protein BcsQ